MDPKAIQQLESDIRNRARELDKKRRSIGPLKNRISLATDMIMKAGALFLDILGVLVNLIPAVGGFVASAISIGGNIFLVLVYLVLHVVPIKGVSGNKTIGVRIICFFFELIPYINILPAFTIGVWYTNSVVRKEDREYNKSIRNALKELAQEERSLQYDMQKYANLIQRSEQMQYDQEIMAAQERMEQDNLDSYDEATLINQINDDEDENDRRAA
jgi:uncharacterized protein YacL (UPF0231 family)